MNKFWEKVFFILSLIFQGSSYLSPYAYGILHRLHHAYADGFRDPHSPSNDKNIFRMMWKTKLIYSKIRKNNYSIKDKFLINLPEWHSFDYFATSWFARIFSGAVYVAFYYYYVPNGEWFWYLLLPIHFIMGPIHGAIINWFAHTIGYRNFESKDTSRNFMPWDLIMLGEGLHNNHHARPKANFAVKWHEFDPVYPIIYCLNKLNIIRLNK